MIGKSTALSVPGTFASDAGAVPTAQAARSVLWSAFENGGLALVSFCSLIVYARFVSPAEFGVFSIALAVVELLGLLVSMLFHDALVQKERVSALHFDTAFSFGLLTSLLLLAACALFAPVFAGLVEHADAAPVLACLALVFPFTALSATLVPAQRRKLEFKALALRSLAGRLAGAALGIGLVVLGAGLWGLVAQQLAVALIGSVVLWFKASERPRLRFRASELLELTRFGAFSVGSLLLAFAVKRVFVVLAGVMLGNELAGYLNLGFRAVDVFWAIAATAVTQVALPVLSRLKAQPERLRRTYRAASEAACLLLFPCFAGLALVAPELIELLFGRSWLPSSPYVSVLALLVLLQTLRFLINPALTALGRPHDALWGLAVELVVVGAGMLLFGAPTLAVAVAIWVARELFALPVMLALLRRGAGIGLRAAFAGAVVPSLAVLAMAVLVEGVRRLLPGASGAGERLCLLVPAGALAYLGSVSLFGGKALAKLLAFVAAARSGRAGVEE
jgi:O-antigen/teichoic acid export membrane protein